MPPRRKPRPFTPADRARARRNRREMARHALDLNRLAAERLKEYDQLLARRSRRHPPVTMTLRKPKHIPGYDSLLLDAWLRDEESLLDRDHWLRSKGIDPDTGHMTVDGLAFVKQLVAEQNARNSTEHDRRRRAA